MWTPLRIDFDLGRESAISPIDKIGHALMMYQGADWDFSLTVAIGAAPVDFSSRTWTLRVWERNRREPFYESNGAVQGSAQGVITGRIPAAINRDFSLTKTRSVQTMSLADCSYEITSTHDTTGAVDRVCEGVLVVSLYG